jgi:hypothetical protein
MFMLIDIYIQSKTDAPNESNKVQARPYQFNDGIATHFATSCPICGSGIWVEANELTIVGELFFYWCEECGAGKHNEIDPMIDPFINPISVAISESSLDSNLDDASEAIDIANETVQEKFKSLGVNVKDVNVKELEPEPKKHKPEPNPEPDLNLGIEQEPAGEPGSDNNEELMAILEKLG